jgi:hypothetical protein
VTHPSGPDYRIPLTLALELYVEHAGLPKDTLAQLQKQAGARPRPEQIELAGETLPIDQSGTVSLKALKALLARLETR